MINADTAFALAVQNGGNFYNYIEMTLRDGTTLDIDKSRITIGGCNIIDNCTTGKFTIGTAIGKIANIRLANYDDYFSTYDFYKAYMTIFVCVDIEDVTYKIRKGVFYVTEPATTGEVITIQAVDEMCKFDKDYDTDLVYPATLSEILTDCCSRCGVNDGLGHFNRYNYTINSKPEDCTYRDVLVYAAQIAACNAKIDETGSLRLTMYHVINDEQIDGGDFQYTNEADTVDGGDFQFNNTETTIDGGLFSDPVAVEIQAIKSISIGTDQLQITGVNVKTDKIEYLAGTNDYCLTITDNKFITTSTIAEDVAKAILADLSGISFRIFTATVLQNPLIQPGDAVHIYDRKGNQYLSVVNAVNYTVGGYTTISCKAASPTYEASMYISPIAQAIAAERKRAEKELSTYDQAVQNMNRLAANSIGFHTTYVTESDGSRVTYMHDKATLADSSIIYKQTADGFFLSQDGGATYTAGFDSSGNAVLNILSAVGITFDWARGGTLSLGGYNNQAGRAYIYNSDNSVDITIGEDGINFYYDYTEDEKTVNRGFSLKKGSISGNGYISCYKVSATYVTATTNIVASKNIDVGVMYLSAKYGINTGGLKVYTKGGEINSAGGEINSAGGTITTFGGHLNTSSGNITTSGGDVKTSGGDLDASTGDVKGSNGVFSSNVSATSLTCEKIMAKYSSGLTLSSNTSCSGTFKVTGNTTLAYISCTKLAVTSGVVTTLLADSGGVDAKNLYVTGSFKTTDTTKLCDGSSDTLGFFGSSGNTRWSVYKLSTYGSITVENCRDKINSLLTALSSYGIIYSS